MKTPELRFSKTGKNFAETQNKEARIAKERR